ncbi:hypothetical protein B296_00057122 [Ensete ventricosum]|uniref:Uncharacterized protein n=1 Tax=Ensete ventricosum TaxID=4639 RepID=A0A426X2M5_ENSVE|nr:hypothetical protein B296_00057122 [Ensete ventricosum]
MPATTTATLAVARRGKRRPGVESQTKRVEERIRAWGCKSLYSGCRRSFVPGNMVALVAYPVVVRFHHARRPCGRSYDRWGFGLTCARSAARLLAPSYLRSTSFLRWVDHVGEPVVRRSDDVAARSLCVISFFPPGRPSRGA